MIKKIKTLEELEEVYKTYELDFIIWTSKKKGTNLSAAYAIAGTIVHEFTPEEWMDHVDFIEEFKYVTGKNLHFGTVEVDEEGNEVYIKFTGGGLNDFDTWLHLIKNKIPEDRHLHYVTKGKNVFLSVYHQGVHYVTKEDFWEEGMKNILEKIPLKEKVCKNKTVTWTEKVVLNTNQES